MQTLILKKTLSACPLADKIYSRKLGINNNSKYSQKTRSNDEFCKPTIKLAEHQEGSQQLVMLFNVEQETIKYMINKYTDEFNTSRLIKTNDYKHETEVSDESKFMHKVYLIPRQFEQQLDR